jgi:hypothetical protein
MSGRQDSMSPLMLCSRRPIACGSFSLIVGPISKNGMAGIRIAPSKFVPCVGGSVPMAMTKTENRFYLNQSTVSTSAE